MPCCNENHKIILNANILERKNYSLPAIILWWKESENLNGVLDLIIIPLRTLKAVALTQPGAVRPDLSAEARQFNFTIILFCKGGFGTISTRQQPVCVMRLIQ